MNVIWAFAGVFIIALAALGSCTSPDRTFITDKNKITEIIVRFPGMQGPNTSAVIKTITNQGEILPLVEFANRYVKDGSRWAGVDSALSSPAFSTRSLIT